MIYLFIYLINKSIMISQVAQNFQNSSKCSLKREVGDSRGASRSSLNRTKEVLWHGLGHDLDIWTTC